MDEYVKQSIDARKNVIFTSYKIEDEDAKKVEALFVEIEKLGAECKDAGEFEAKFAASPLNKQYMDLFTELATSAQLATGASSAGASVGAAVAGGVASAVLGGALGQAKRAAMPVTRARIHQEAYDAARDIPVVGDAINVGQKVSYARHLGRLFGKKKKEE